MSLKLNSPDVIRYALLVALGITGYLLVLSWAADSADAGGRENQEPVAGEISTPSGDEGVAGDQELVPPLPSGVVDLPDDSMASPASATVTHQDPTLGAVSSDRMIVVETPLLNVLIDRYGGDVVKTSLLRHAQSLSIPDVPVTLLDRTSHKTYEAQSGLTGLDRDHDRPLYMSTQSRYRLDEGSLEVVLTHRAEGIETVKTFAFEADQYVIPVSYRVRNLGEEPLHTRLFVQLKRDASPVESRGAGFFAPRAYLGAALTTDDSRYEKLSFEDVESSNFSAVVTGGWIAILQHYFIAAWVADRDQRYDYFGRRGADGLYRFGFIGPETVIPSGREGNFSARFYAGPKDQASLRNISENLNLTVDYGWFWWLSVPMFMVLDLIQDYVYNWGIAIILLTVAIKLALWPLASTSYRSMAKLRKVTPQMKRIQERYSDDSAKLRQAMMELYQKEKVNPLQGCLPMLPQMPVFIALYWVLYESVELRHAPFFGWIQDLSSHDPFFVLPILMGASMFAAQALNPPAPNPMQQRMMRLMPVVFTVILAFFSAGLVLYWLMNNVLSFAQQWWITRRFEKADVRPSS